MRKYHRKTRTGCSQCKQRRIKCDETKPSCLNCSRRAVKCSLTFLTPSAPSIHYKYQFQRRDAATNTLDNAGRVLGDTSKTPGLDLAPANVELFQHYTTVAHRTLSGIRSPELWEFTVPQLALKSPFVMHGMLALSALHIATLHPTRRREMITKATWNESQALPSYQSVIGKVNDENIHAIFVFSGFVAQYSLATSQAWTKSRNRVEYETIDDLPEFPPNWFHIIRGTSTMLYTFFPLLMRGPFGKVLQQQPDAIPFETNPEDIYLEALTPLFLPAEDLLDEQLYDHSASSSSSPEGSSPMNEANRLKAKHLADLEICSRTLMTLRRTYVLRFSPCGTIDDIAACYIWPGIVDKAYIRLLNERKPEALILFAHYCVLLSYCDYTWYFYGVGKRFIAAIWRSLGPEWRQWISWPVAVTGAISDGVVELD